MSTPPTAPPGGCTVTAHLTRRGRAHLLCLVRSTGIADQRLIDLSLHRELARWCKARVPQGWINTMDEILQAMDAQGAPEEET